MAKKRLVLASWKMKATQRSDLQTLNLGRAAMLQLLGAAAQLLISLQLRGASVVVYWLVKLCLFSPVYMYICICVYIYIYRVRTYN